MAIIEFDEYKVKLNALKPTLRDLEAALKLDESREELESLRRESEREGFWNDVKAAQKNQQRSKQLENKIAGFAVTLDILLQNHFHLYSSFPV